MDYNLREHLHSKIKSVRFPVLVYVKNTVLYGSFSVPSEFEFEFLTLNVKPSKYPVFKNLTCKKKINISKNSV